MAAPTFNKYRSTSVFGALQVRDFTNSAGTSVLEVASTDLSGNFISRGDSTFTKKVICNALLADINANNVLCTKEYVDTAVSTGGSVSLSGTNAFTGNNSYNVNFPTSSLPTSTAITTSSIVNKGMLDTLYSTLANEVKTNTANAFTVLPTSTIAPTLTSHFVNKQYADSIAGGVGGASLAGTNPFTGFNSYNVNFPTSTLPTNTTITTSSIVNKGMNDTLYSTLANQVKTNTANAFTSTNTFNSNFPTSSLPTNTGITTSSIVNKGMNDTLYSTLANEVKTNTANAFTSTNTFNSNFPTSSLPTSTAITTSSIVNKGMLDTIYQTLAGMSSYLTTAVATATFSTLANEVKTNTANAFSSTNTFNNNFPTSSLPTSTAITTSSIVNKGMNDTLYSTLANEVKTNTANAFTSSNTFNSILPSSSLQPTLNTHFTNKAYVDSVAGGGGGTSILPLNNNFTGINQFQAPDFIFNYTATETTSQGNFKVIEDSTKTQYFIFTCNGSPSFQTNLTIPTTTTMNYLCVGSGGRGSGGSGVIGTGGGGGAISHGSFVMVGGTTYTITVGTIAGGGVANLSSIVGGTVNIVANGGKDGNSGTSPVNFTGVIATASATGVISSTNVNGKAGGQGRNDALTPNGDAGNSFPFRYNTATNTIIQTASFYGSGGAGTKSGTTGSTGGGFDAGGIAGGSANNQGGSGTSHSGGGGGATSLTSQAGGSGSGIVIIYFTPTTFVNSTNIQNGIIVANKIITPVLNINTNTTLNRINQSTILFTGGSPITFTLPASGMVVDGDQLLLRKTSTTAYVITIAVQGGVLTQMVNTNNTTVSLPSTTIFAGTVFQLRLVARKTVGSFSQVIWLIV